MPEPLRFWILNTAKTNYHETACYVLPAAGLSIPLPWTRRMLDGLYHLVSVRVPYDVHIATI
jgi:hypothetical protein